MTLRKKTSIVFAIYALFSLWAGVGMIGGGYWQWGVAVLAAAGLIVLGLRHRDDAPRRSTILLIVATVIPVLAMYWIAIILLPVAILLSWMAIATEPGRRDPVAAPAT